MIELPLFLAFVFAVTVLMLIPGPNVALIVAHSIAYGSRYGLLTVAGTSCAMALQLGLTVLGMTQLLGVLGEWFAWIRWLGVAYLVYLGVKTWRASPLPTSDTQAQPKSARAIFTRALLVSATNPKTLLFYGAFFPQFLEAAEPAGARMAVLAVTFLLLALIVDSLWALAAGRARAFLKMRQRLSNRIGGGFLMAAGIGLAMARTK